MKQLLSAIIGVLICSSTLAVELEQHEKTSVPPECRFEILQSSLAAKLTLKVDKFTGTVSQIVETKDGGKTWQPITKRPHPLDKTEPGKVNYQVFTSGLALKFTFLINVNTGATWQLLNSAEGISWDPII
jgi:photosystem II stability/assembly factor-like uncharacterized protein